MNMVDCNAMSFISGSIENESEWIEAGEKTQKIKSNITSEITFFLMDNFANQWTNCENFLFEVLISSIAHSISGKS
jgi:hypothetical protein